MVWGLNHLPVRRGLLLRYQFQDWSPSSQVVDDEVWASLVILATVISLPKRRGFNIHMELSYITKSIHIVFYTIMTLHDGFLCAFADEDVDIEVINLLSCKWDTPSRPSAVGFPGTASEL